MNDKTIRSLLRGDRFIARSGQFGDRTQDYFAIEVSETDAGLIIRAKSANMSESMTASDSELQLGRHEVAYDIWSAAGRWHLTWEEKGEPDLLETVERPVRCFICGGVRSVTKLHGDPLCINCKRQLLDDRICDCALYGEHIPVLCTVCGATHSTKNIQCIGARHVHGIYPDSCCCREGWFFHDCKEVKFVKGQVVRDVAGDCKFVKWVDPYKEGK